MADQQDDGVGRRRFCPGREPDALFVLAIRRLGEEIGDVNIETERTQLGEC